MFHITYSLISTVQAFLFMLQQNFTEKAYKLFIAASPNDSMAPGFKE